jgi:hypothetical protein
MEDRNGSGGIDGYRRKRCPALGIAAGGTRKSIQRLSLIIGLDPGAQPPMLRSKIALSVTSIWVPLSAKMRRTSLRESWGFSGTAIPPARMIPRNQ